MLIRKNTRNLYAVPTSPLDGATMAAQHAVAYFEHFIFIGGLKQ